MNPRKHIFDSVYVKGVLELVSASALKKGQEVLYISKTINSVLLVKNIISKHTFIAEDLFTKRTGTYKINDCIKKPVLIVNDNTGFEQVIDVNLTPFNFKRILENVHKEDGGFINVIDTIDPSQRFNEDGTLNKKYLGRGFKRFIRLVSEDKAKSFKYTNIRMKKVKNIYREPDIADNCDAFFKINEDCTEIVISSGELKGTWTKSE